MALRIWLRRLLAVLAESAATLPPGPLWGAGPGSYNFTGDPYQPRR